MRAAGWTALVLVTSVGSVASAQRAIVLAPPEKPVEQHGPDSTLTLAGSALFGAPYLAGVAYAALRDDSPRGMDRRYLYVPVAGPLLAIRGVGCDDSSRPCSTSGGAGVWSLLFLDSAVQATGVVLLAFGLTSTEPIAPRDAATHVWIAPHAAARNDFGLTIGSAF